MANAFGVSVEDILQEMEYYVQKYPPINSCGEWFAMRMAFNTVISNHYGHKRGRAPKQAHYTGDDWQTHQGIQSSCVAAWVYERVESPFVPPDTALFIVEVIEGLEAFAEKYKGKRRVIARLILEGAGDNEEKRSDLGSRQNWSQVRRELRKEAERLFSS